MTATDDRLLTMLADANPHPRDTIADAAEDPRAEATLASILAQPVSARTASDSSGAGVRMGRRVLAPVLSLVLVSAVVAASLHVGGHQPVASSPPAARDELVLRLHTTSEVPRITDAAVAREIQILTARLRLAGSAPVRMTRDGDQIVVHSRQLTASRLARTLLTRDPELAFTDWEQNVLTPNGRTVASLLWNQDREAELLSQGRADGPGTADAGARSLYAAVQLASRQPARPDATTQTRRGAESFAFAPAKSATCPTFKLPCWASGPTATPTSAYRTARHAGVTRPIVLTIPQGTIVVRATLPAAALEPDYRNANSRYFVMRDDAPLTGLELRRVTAATDATGQPDITAAMTSTGARAFHTLTATIAHRGARLRLPATPLYQHFAIIINSALASVPLIDYHNYPDGVFDSSTIQIDGGLSHTQATKLAETLSLHTLPLRTTIAPSG